MSIFPRRASGNRPRAKKRTLETTVSDIANRPPPIRRSIFDLLDTLIRSREKPPVSGPPASGPHAPADAPRPAPKDRAPKNSKAR